MAKFLAIFTGPAIAGFTPPDQETVAKGQLAWGDWMARHAQQLVDVGGPLGKTKKVSSTGIADVSNNIAAYVVVQAEDHGAAAAMFLDHPHFTIFPGDGVEVMPLIAIPGT